METTPVFKAYSGPNLLPPADGSFDLRALFDRFLDQFDAVAISRGIFLEITVSEQTPRYFSGDPARLNDILKNLLAYALNHLDGGGIFFNVHACPVQHNECRIDLTVTTTGVGIPYYKLNTIFQPVTETGGQGHNSLYIAKTLAALMGGDLTVENTFGWGTKYCAHLIMKAEAPECYNHSSQNKLTSASSTLNNIKNM